MSSKRYKACVEAIKDYLYDLNEDNSAVKNIKKDLLDYIDNMTGRKYYLPCCSEKPVFKADGVEYCTKCYSLLKERELYERCKM